MAWQEAELLAYLHVLSRYHSSQQASESFGIIPFDRHIENGDAAMGWMLKMFDVESRG